jgi:Flp pilus assembly protein TadD
VALTQSVSKSREATTPAVQYRLAVNEEESKPSAESDTQAPTEEAIEAFRRAAWLEPDEADFHFILGEALLRAGRPAESAVAFEEATWADPASGQYQMALGFALRCTGRINDAVSAFRQAVLLLPGDAHARNALGVCLMDLGQTGEGVRQLALGAGAAPSSADLHLNLGMALVATGSREDAVAPLRRAAELAPGDPEARVQLGAVLQTLGREAEAHAAFGEALSLAPRHLESRPELRAVFEALALTDLRQRLRDELALPRRRGRWFLAPLGLLLDYLPTVPRRVGAALAVVVLALVALTTARLAHTYLDALAMREDVARIARTPVRDDGEVLARLMSAVDRHQLTGAIQPGQFTIESQRSFRRIRCEYSVPFSVWRGLGGSIPFRIDVDSPVLIPNEDVEIH